ncbi:malonyl-CoA decarboxylase, mitochondrial-like isoform X2 [Mercenaria mercenaria]|uniref:malonyl-CoA decarboxylase, mitochondrial-like isoform X2 n=1 Tax=Mercenaria mercenaria TaxID=6596 RepID=UPI00234EB19E|nr:malonyl-CoA decarboxylase, mitochondrial-like isoform X2 [Mercenaria mercenaria]
MQYSDTCGTGDIQRELFQLLFTTVTVYLLSPLVTQLSSNTDTKAMTVLNLARIYRTCTSSSSHYTLHRNMEFSRLRCRQFCQTYRHMEESEKLALLCHISENYGVNQELIVDIVKNFLESKERGEAVILRIEERMRGALSAKYQVLFSDIGRIEGGVKFLVDMRADIMHLLSSTKDIDRAHLLDLQHALKDILSLWFTVGFLNLERITWQSSCEMLQKISEYEAVHPVRHWQDLKRRVGPYRRCFVFTHSSMPHEPIVVLHCALTSEISSSIHSIIGNRGYSTSSLEQEKVEEGPEDPNKINTAMFYSVSNTQKGLQGVDLGNYLIKKVAGELQHEWPQMTQFSSISPIPGFRDWLNREINAACREDTQDDLQPRETDKGSHSSQLLTETDIECLCNSINTDKSFASALQIFKEHVMQHTWVNKEDTVTAMKAPLMRLCARYLYLEKRRGYALNSVANFHLQNGAVLWRLNWMADTTLRGLTNSCGLMVNYRYYLEDTVGNSQQYIEHKVINTSDHIRQLCET